MKATSILVFISFCVMIFGCAGPQLPAHIKSVKVEGNLAYKALVTASANYYDPNMDVNFDPSCIVDGITYESHYPTTYWLLPLRTTGFVVIDILELSRIYKIRILNTRNNGFENMGTRDFHVDIIDSKGTPQTIWRDRFAHLGEWKEIELSNVITSKIIVYVDSFYKLGGGINEVEIIGEQLKVSRSAPQEDVSRTAEQKVPQPKVSVQKAPELLIGKVNSVKGDTIEVSVGSRKGVKSGDKGRVFYKAAIEGKEKAIYIASFKITYIADDTSMAEIEEKTGDVQVGYLVEIRR